MADFSETEIQAVWEKGTQAPPNDPREWRKDDCTAWIRRQDYGKEDSPYGWAIDHITPKSKDGSDHISNLRPLQWKNNAARGDGPLTCPVRSNGNQNVGV